MNEKELAAALAHEVKNPLGLIKANVDIIKLESGTAYEKSINIINREINKITSVIEAFGHIKAGSTLWSRVSIPDMLMEIIYDYNISLQNKNINFRLINNSDYPYVQGNENKLSILFFNIIKNAVEAIEEKGEIVAEIYNSDSRLIVEIKDNGKGIEDYILKNIGKPYLTGKENGNGLGVAICKSIVGEHNGKINYKNNELGGCTVEVEL